jgi:hypothetical protein
MNPFRLEEQKMEIIVGRRFFEGALAFAAHAPGAGIHVPDGGRFVLEKHPDAAAGSIPRLREKTLS